MECTWVRRRTTNTHDDDDDDDVWLDGYTSFKLGNFYTHVVKPSQVKVKCQDKEIPT